MRFAFSAIAVAAAAVSVGWLGRQDVGWHGDALWRMACAMLWVYGVPGWLALRTCFPRRRFDALEQIPLAFGLGHVLVAGECVAATLAHGNLGTAWTIHAVATALLGVGFGVARWASHGRVEPPEAPSSRVFPVAAWIALAATLALLWGAGGLWKAAPGDEEAYNLVLTRKFLDLERYDATAFMYRKGMPGSYLFAPYPFVTAMLAKASALDPIIVYTNYRAFWGLVALSAFYATARVLTRRRDVACVVLIAGCMLALSNAAGQFEEQVGAVYWGQLTPVSHAADFGLGVLLPVMVLFLLHAFRDGRWFSAWVWLTPIVFLSCILTHTREAVQALFYGGLIAAAVLIAWRREWRRLAPLAIVALLTIALGKAFQHYHHAQVPHVVAHEAANRVSLENGFREIYEKHPPAGFFALWYFNGDPSLFRTYFSFAMLAAPLLLLVRERSGWTVVLWGVLTLFMLIYRIPPLVLLIVQNTYSEIFWTPARYVSTLSYLVFGLFVFATAPMWDRLIERLRGRGAFARWTLLVDAALIVGAGVFVLTHGFYWIAVKWNRAMDFVYVWLLVGGVWALSRRRTRTVDEARVLPPSIRHPFAVCVALIVMLVPQFYLADAGRDLVQRALETRLPQSYASEADFYRAHYEDPLPPYEMMAYVRAEAPAGSVVVYPPEAEMKPLMFWNHYTFSAGLQPFLRDVEFVERYCEVVGRPLPQGRDLFDTYRLKSNLYGEILQQDQPFFGEAETPERLRRLVEAFEIDYVTAPDAVARRIAERHGAARVVHSTGGWTLVSFPHP